MNILEILVGAGSWSATLQILNSLGGHASRPPRFGHYTYTDINQKVLRGAKTKFREWGGLIAFKSLDILASPQRQGFKC